MPAIDFRDHARAESARQEYKNAGWVVGKVMKSETGKYYFQYTWPGLPQTKKIDGKKWSLMGTYSTRIGAQQQVYRSRAFSQKGKSVRMVKGSKKNGMIKWGVYRPDWKR